MTDWISQFLDEIHRWILQYGAVIWTDAYNKQKTEGRNGIFIAALLPNEKVEEALRTNDWMVDPGRLRPGCVQYGEDEVSYWRHGSEAGYEPLVIEREFAALKPPGLELSEEFRLFHNLYFDAPNEKYIKITDDGNEHDVVLMEPDKISVHTAEIKQFLGIKGMQLVCLFDVTRKSPEKLDKIGRVPESARKDGPNFRYRYTTGDYDIFEGSFVRVWGKVFLKGFAREDCGIWPYEKDSDREEDFPEFIVGVDEKGKEVLARCDPHGGQYLRLVYFRPSVLNRYYDNPSKFSVEDGYLRCGHLWGIEIHNDCANYVTAFLGDLGRDLPASERSYWRSFNIPPAGPMSETAFRRSLMAEFADPTKPDLVFKQRFEDFQASWEQKNGWPLFKPLSREDSHCFASLRIPATSEQGEFDTQVMYLTKVLIDSINEFEIEKAVGTIAGEKGRGKLERYSNSKKLPDVEKHMQLLRNLQSLRSTGAAHRKGDNYIKIAEKLGLEAKDRRAVFTELLKNAIGFLEALKCI